MISTVSREEKLRIYQDIIEKVKGGMTVVDASKLHGFKPTTFYSYGKSLGFKNGHLAKITKHRPKVKPGFATFVPEADTDSGAMWVKKGDVQIFCNSAEALRTILTAIGA